ncbi:MAG: DUF255 domain-containing protein [Saprospiraceae bacterium]|nr:DUF255 domain-containing protein [Saprospiraceae bacterium]
MLWFAIAVSSNLQSQTVPWIAFDSIEQVLHTHPKPIMIFIYTDWCKVCALQEETTYSDPTTIELLSEEFHCIKLNAAERDSIYFLGRTYHYKPSGVSDGMHELAEILAHNNGSRVFPTTTFMTPQFEVAYAHAGLLRIKDLQKIQQHLIP